MDRNPTDEDLEEEAEAYYTAPLYHLERFMAYRNNYYAVKAIEAYTVAGEDIPTELKPYLIMMCNDWFSTKGNIQIANTIENAEQQEVMCGAVDYELSFGTSSKIIEACRKIHPEEPETLARYYRTYKKRIN